MKTILALTATLMVGSNLPASAQGQPNIAPAPADRSTGPTVPPTRSVELSPVVPPPGGTDSKTSDRPAAGGIDNDPHNPTSVPGQSSGLGASPTR